MLLAKNAALNAPCEKGRMRLLLCGRPTGKLDTRPRFPGDHEAGYERSARSRIKRSVFSQPRHASVMDLP